jgi:hypothetical protein
MEEIQQFVIPTQSKSKISHLLSYPIGAEAISAALASTVQLSRINLHFYSGFDLGLRRGHYEFLRVEYLRGGRPASDWPVSTLYNRPPQELWEVVVQPVPRPSRNRIRQFILEKALPSIEGWLNERSDLERDGSDILAFFYDETDDEFVGRPLTQLGSTR